MPTQNNSDSEKTKVDQLLTCPECSHYPLRVISEAFLVYKKNGVKLSFTPSNESILDERSLLVNCESCDADCTSSEKLFKAKKELESNYIE